MGSCTSVYSACIPNRETIQHNKTSQSESESGAPILICLIHIQRGDDALSSLNSVNSNTTTTNPMVYTEFCSPLCPPHFSNSSTNPSWDSHGCNECHEDDDASYYPTKSIDGTLFVTQR